MPRANTILANQNNVIRKIVNPRTSGANMGVVIDFVLNHPERFMSSPIGPMIWSRMNLKEEQ